MPWPDERCPRCDAADPVPILYGMPTGEAGQAAARGELVLGGCAVGPDAPDRQGLGSVDIPMVPILGL